MGVYSHTNHILLELSSAVPDVVFSVVGGVFNNDISLVLSCPLSGVSIYYTTDGSTPDETDTLYSGAISISENTTVKAKAYKAGYSASVVVSEVYQFVCAVPTANYASGTYPAEIDVELSCATTGATIYYTTDGSTPDAGDTEYTVAFEVAVDTTVKAIAIKTDYSDSSVLTLLYEILLNFFLVSGDYFVVDGENLAVQAE
jgi:hypothetical protein